MSTDIISPMPSNSPAVDKPYEAKAQLRSRRLIAIKQLDRLDWVIRVFAVISIVSLVATIALIGLAQARYTHPLLPLYTFSACISCFVFIKIIDCFQQNIAKKNNIDLQVYYRTRQPMPKKEKPKAKKEEKATSKKV